MSRARRPDRPRRGSARGNGLALSSTLLLLGCAESPGTDGEPRALAPVLALAASDDNRLASFRPGIAWEEEPIAEWREFPRVLVTGPWSSEAFTLDVPEALWGERPGVHGRAPLFLGRALDAPTRFTEAHEAPRSAPRWRRGENGSIALDCELEGGHVVRFRVIPHDRALEIRVGFTNAGPGRIVDFAAQLCTHADREPNLSAHGPETSRLLVDGRLASWDAAGQDLSWIDAFRSPGADAFERSCFFVASETDRRVPPGDVPNHMVLERSLDVPAIAKLHADGGAGVIVYSPDAADVLYNTFVPCFHADPRLAEIPPGTTGWTRSYQLFFEGDLERAFTELARIHRDQRELEPVRFAAGPPLPRPRSVILVSLDTLRADHLGLYGYARDTSPGLDRLASESLVFERAFTSATWTRPAHMTMLTGLYSHQHGVVEREAALARETRLLTERLRDAGYQTVGLYFEGQIHARHGFDRGFDVFRSHADVDEADEHLGAVLAGLDPERPLFLFLHLFDVHAGPLGDVPGPLYDCPPPYDELFLEDAAARLPELPEDRLWNEDLVTGEHALEGLIALYDGGIRRVDDRLAAWIEAWRRSGLLDRALLIVTSDHGEGLGQRGWIRGHGAPYLEGLRVPLIARHPGGLRAGEREPATVHLVDVTPTVLDWARLESGADLPGRSFFRGFRGFSDGREVLASDGLHYDVLLRWPEKWTRTRRDGEERTVRVDLERDPLELDEQPVSAADFEARLAAFLAGVAGEHAAAVRAEGPSPEEREQLRRLGYGGDDRR